MIPYVTIVWRPNVWKSSIFNLLTWHKIAIVSDIENTTRDIIEYQITDEDNDLSYIVADSGWLTEWTNEEILHDVRKRVEETIERSDIIVFVLEWDKITDLDEEIARMLRKSGKHIIVVGNKADNENKRNEAWQLFSLGFKELVIASAAQNSWLDELKSKIATNLKKQWFIYKEEKYDEDFIKIAIIGRPNVGKSSIVNAITWENRVIVKDLPGTTRDSIDSMFEWEWNKFILIDTAWIRRSGKIWARNIEQWSVLRSERSISRADIIALVIDWFEWITSWDQHILEKALEEKKWIIIVINKWDKVLAKPGVDKDSMMNRYINYLQEKFDYLSYVTPIFTSAVSGKRVDEVLEVAVKIKEERSKRVKTWVFNQFLEQIIYKHAPTWNKKSHKPKIYYGSQVDVNPPKFVISINNERHFHFSYKRYIENQIREHFWFYGTPIDIEFKERVSIFKKKEKEDKPKVKIDNFARANNLIKKKNRERK